VEASPKRLWTRLIAGKNQIGYNLHGVNELPSKDAVAGGRFGTGNSSEPLRPLRPLREESGPRALHQVRQGRQGKRRQAALVLSGCPCHPVAGASSLAWRLGKAVTVKHNALA